MLQGCYLLSPGFDDCSDKTFNYYLFVSLSLSVYYNTGIHKPFHWKNAAKHVFLKKNYIHKPTLHCRQFIASSLFNQ